MRKNKNREQFWNSVHHGICYLQKAPQVPVVKKTTANLEITRTLSSLNANSILLTEMENQYLIQVFQKPATAAVPDASTPALPDCNVCREQGNPSHVLHHSEVEIHSRPVVITLEPRDVASSILMDQVSNQSNHVDIIQRTT